MGEKPKLLHIAMTASFPGYWGSSDDTAHHAIASACSEGADRGDVFVVYDAYEGCEPSQLGGMNYLAEHGEPEVEGVYDAAGNRIGDNLLDAAKAARRGDFQPEHNALDWASFKRLRDHTGS